MLMLTVHSVVREFRQQNYTVEWTIVNHGKRKSGDTIYLPYLSRTFLWCFHLFPQFLRFSRTCYALQWNLDIANLYTTKSSVKWTIFFAPVIMKYEKERRSTNRNLVIANKFCQSLGPSLYQGSTLVTMTSPASLSST